MIFQSKEIIEKHITTHTERSVDDRCAVSVLETFLRSDGRINPNFASDDKWPNHDGTFEFVPEPDQSRQPKQTFYVQIKGTQDYTEKDGVISYSLKSLAFPAFICCNVSHDPGILFVVFKPRERGEERVFWKYMSEYFLNHIDFSHTSTTVSFTARDEIRNTDESVREFCRKLQNIVNRHTFVSQLSQQSYTRLDVERIIQRRNRDICESIDRMEADGESRDEVSERMLSSLDDLCLATLLLDAIENGFLHANLRLAWERSLMDISTKYLGVFLRGLRYVGRRIPDEGQSERLMLKYYDFLWRIRKLLRTRYRIGILDNLEKFPLYSRDNTDQEYYRLVAGAVKAAKMSWCDLHQSRYFIQKKTPFFVGTERYYEVTLQLAGVYASKYNRITAYTKEDISSNYTVKVGYADIPVNLWGTEMKIKVITGWQVSIDPVCLNKLGRILQIPTRLSSDHGEYRSLMSFLKKTGISFLDLIDLKQIDFSSVIDEIYSRTKTSSYKEVLLRLRAQYSESSDQPGKHVVRYLLINLREETMDHVMPTRFSQGTLCSNLYLDRSCLPFEKNPFISNLANSKTGRGHARQITRITSVREMELNRPYLYLKQEINRTGEIYKPIWPNFNPEPVRRYNEHLDKWECRQGFSIRMENDFLYIDSYEKDTLAVLRRLQELSRQENKGQKEYNRSFLKQNPMADVDRMKKSAVEEAFVHSRLLLIYGAAGTGKTTLINYISNLMKDQRKLFLTKTHTALQNLKRRIDNPGAASDFISIDSFTQRIRLPDYGVIFVDECSTIDNRTMRLFLEKMQPDTFLVMAGDIHQIESIDFGNWFFYAKETVNTPGSKVELLSTWRTDDQSLISLWDEVRNRGPLITEKLVIDGPFSENIGPNILRSSAEDEVILCLNYDGKFGLNNMNNYFQAANSGAKSAMWAEWIYKVGDPILFNDSRRFPLLYNNLKGRIVDLERVTEADSDRITFTVDVEISLTEADCRRESIEFIKAFEGKTRIRFSVYHYEREAFIREDDEQRMKSIIPFQLAYAVSIHKAQGLEYDSVKVIIPSSNAEKITHGVFYTAITRAKKHLKIYWSSETMQKIVKEFTADVSDGKSLEIVKQKLESGTR